MFQKNIDIRPCLTGYKRRIGGDVRYSRVKDHITRTLKKDGNIVCTTFYDFYGLGTSFPKLEEAKKGKNISEKLRVLQQAVLEDISLEMGNKFNPSRFIPYFQMHEFEGLLFSDCEALASAIGKRQLSAEFQKVRNEFESPEDINDNKETSPSHRILNIHESYNKTVDGALAVMKIGLEKIREECPLFDEWLCNIESLAG